MGKNNGGTVTITATNKVTASLRETSTGGTRKRRQLLSVGADVIFWLAKWAGLRRRAWVPINVPCQFWDLLFFFLFFSNFFLPLVRMGIPSPVCQLPTYLIFSGSNYTKRGHAIINCPWSLYVSPPPLVGLLGLKNLNSC